jgi:predicted TIM-barrel fold metal-dependent hydrolase
MCQGPDLHPRAPKIEVPKGAWDCHVHIYGDPRQYPMKQKRRYTPAPAALAEYRQVQSALGLEHAVIVHPSIYVDFSTTLDALEQSGGKWRAIVTPDVPFTDKEMEHMHALGVRGVRFHPLRGGAERLTEMESICARIAPLGWHAQFHVDARQLPEFKARFEKLPVDIVIDHIGKMAPAADASLDEPGFQLLLRWLREERAWVKLSAPNRFGDARPPYPHVTPFAQALAQANIDRVVWATDWPHSSCPGYMPNDAELLDMLADWVPDAGDRKRVLVDNPQRLYGG